MSAKRKRPANKPTSTTGVSAAPASDDLTMWDKMLSEREVVVSRTDML